MTDIQLGQPISSSSNLTTSECRRLIAPSARRIKYVIVAPLKLFILDHWGKFSH